MCYVMTLLGYEKKSLRTIFKFSALMIAPKLDTSVRAPSEIWELTVHTPHVSPNPLSTVQEDLFVNPRVGKSNVNDAISERE